MHKPLTTGIFAALLLTAPIAANAESPLFEHASVQANTPSQNKSVVGKGYYADLYGYYGNYYSSLASTYGSIAMYYKSPSYYNSASGYAYQAYSYYHAAYLDQTYGY